MKESKRDSFLDAIKSHEIDERIRELLSKTSRIGQKLTTRQLLAKIFKKHRAGVELTLEEKALLFAEHETQGELPDSFEDMDTEDDDQASLQKGNETLSMPSVPAAPVVNSVVSSRPSESQPGEASTIAHSILSQFAAFKSKVESDAGGGFHVFDMGLSTSTTTATAASPVLSLDSEIAPEHKYVAVEREIPIATDGTIIRELPATENGVSDSTAVLPEISSELRQLRALIHRPETLKVKRMELPICSMEQEIVETVQNHDVTIVCGETGSGKTTQVLSLSVCLTAVCRDSCPGSCRSSCMRRGTRCRARR